MKTKIVSMSTVINRNFYQSLRRHGRTHTYIMNLIQPERYDQFFFFFTPVIPETTYDKKISWWDKFKLKKW